MPARTAALELREHAQRQAVRRLSRLQGPHRRDTVLERLEPLRLGHLHAAILRPPRVERRVADAVLAAEVGYRRPSLVLLEHPDPVDPLCGSTLRKPRSLHHPSPGDGF